MDTTPERNDLEGELSTVTDEEWRAAHERLLSDLLDVGHPDADDGLAAGFAYEWTPGE